MATQYVIDPRERPPLFSCLIASQPQLEARASAHAILFAGMLHAAIVSGLLYRPEHPVQDSATTRDEVVALIVPDIEKLVKRVVKDIVEAPESKTVEKGAEIGEIEGVEGGAEPLNDLGEAALDALARGVDAKSIASLTYSPDFSVQEILGKEGRGEDELFDFELPPQKKMSMSELEENPMFTPYTVPPVLKNRDRVKRELDRLYPPLLLESGVGGTVVLWFLIDEDGTIRKAQIKEGAYFNTFDKAALRVAKQMQFTPALYNGIKVPVWIALPVEFRPGA